MAPGHLIKRNCVTCPTNSPSCDACPSGKICSLSVQTCEQCPVAKCISQTSVTKRSAGAIAGGVVGGLVGIGIIVGIIFWYKFRGRRNRHLQDMKEAALEYDAQDGMNPYDLQEDDEDDEEAEEEEFKRKSHMSSGHSNNAIPIMFPARRDTPSSSGRSQRVQGFRTGTPTIRDSIHDSEYSVESEYIPGANNQALRAYDVAVQGLPNLIHVSKPVRPPSGRHMLGRINEGEADETGTVRSQGSRGSHGSQGSNRSENRGGSAGGDNPSPRGSIASSARTKQFNSYAQLPPEPPLTRTATSSTRRTLVHANPVSDAGSDSPFDDSASISNARIAEARISEAHQAHLTEMRLPRSQTRRPSQQNMRYSKASSEYVADLPEEAKLYKGLY